MIEAMKQALDALEQSGLRWPNIVEAITSLRQAIAVAEEYSVTQEPVAWGMQSDDGSIYDCITPEEHSRVEGEYTIPLYTHPQPKQPLTDERLELIGHADLGINNIHVFNGYGEDVPEGRTPIYAGYKATHGIKDKNT